MRYILLIFLLLIAYTGYSQSLEKEDLVVGRPGVTESPLAVPAGALQIETGIINEKSRWNNNGTEYDQSVLSVPNTLFRIGLLDNFEVRLAIAEYSVINTIVDGVNVDGPTKGFSPIVLGAKVEITEEKGLIPKTALLMHLEIPSGSAGFRPKFVNPDVVLLMSHALGNNFTLDYNIGAEWDIENQIANGKYAVSLGFGIVEKLGMYVELFGLTSINNSSQHMFDSGITYMVNPMIQLDLSAGISVYGEYYSFISSGVSFRLFK